MGIYFNPFYGKYIMKQNAITVGLNKEYPLKEGNMLLKKHKKEFLLQDIDQIIAGSKADANKYFNNYTQPFGEGEIYNLARGWFNTARTHKFLGLDISVNVQGAIVPPEKQNFTFIITNCFSFLGLKLSCW